MKRTIVLTVLAALLPIAVAAQVETPPASSANPKYELYVGAGYTRLRQALTSYSGLVGGKATLARNFGQYFQLGVSADYYKMGTGHNNIPNPGNPSVYSVTALPTVRTTIYGPVSGQLFVELGMEHTGGLKMNPSSSVAGGFGGGLTYSLSKRLAVQLTGDRVAASFSLENNSAQNAYSSILTWNARGTMGLVYKF